MEPVFPKGKQAVERKFELESVLEAVAGLWVRQEDTL